MSERLRILEKIEVGELSVAEGVRLLEELDVGPCAEDGQLKRSRWANVVRQVVFCVGLALILGGATLVAFFYVGWLARGWQVAGWILFVLGVIDMVLAWWLQRTPWLSVWVKGGDGDDVALELPVSLGAAAAVIRLSASFVPELRESGVSELISAARQGLQRGEPLVIKVDDEEDGDSVRVTFG